MIVLAVWIGFIDTTVQVPVSWECKYYMCGFYIYPAL